MAAWTRVEFPAYDGLLLRGNLFRTETPNAPTVILTQGLALLKEHYLQNWATRFQQAGFNALTYDHRNFGHSEGSPRNEVDLNAQADDYSAAVTFVKTLEGVNADKVFIWGIGHSGGAAGTAAAFDRRISGVILTMPSQSGEYDYNNWPPYLHEKYAETRALGRDAANEKADFWRFWPVSDVDRTGKGESMLSDDTAYNWAQGAFKLTEEGGNKFDNKVAITSLHSIYKARPGVYFPKISPTPVLLLAATDDPVASSYATQVETFKTMAEPKEFVDLQGHHLAVYFGEQFEVGVKAMIAWLQKYSQ
ncbi:hypothetical protein VHEMI04236 [[Torrubiella] hemipterigena]|uniref:Serine aminopeptidase S33 domain-containing protein n=1 Tax=[Torrubiella] hemipterigena TaxID=1531966 RepID=A0A0A1TD92_9HYPO|nr:hypothetical protein VHEMI04236 [[Torrubiella] hemipterigena]